MILHMNKLPLSSAYELCSELYYICSLSSSNPHFNQTAVDPCVKSLLRGNVPLVCGWTSCKHVSVTTMVFDLLLSFTLYEELCKQVQMKDHTFT